MRIEVHIPDQPPVLYDLNRPTMVVGSSRHCDIIITESYISRQHLSIVKEGELCFVMDMKSTNGSYIDEEKLIPGQRVDFNSFFPVRLGAEVLLFLINDEENKSEILDKNQNSIPKPHLTIPEREDVTRVASLKDLREASTHKLIDKRTDVKKDEKKKNNFTGGYVVALLILGVGFYFNNPFKVKDQEVKVIPQDVRLDSEGRVIGKNKPVFLQEKKPLSLLTFVPEFSEKMNETKCQGDLSLLCENLKSDISSPWGAVKSKNDILIFVNFAPYLDNAKKILVPTVSTSDEEVTKFGAALFMIDALKTVPDFTIYGEAKLIFGFYLMNESAKTLKILTSVNPTSLGSLRFIIPSRRLMEVKDKPAQINDVIKDSYDSLYLP
jgi:pSer/pThr/pTyr-binding forkhead associated (FHA) protein